jgi:putative molybdopterin biosynthesis protein
MEALLGLLQGPDWQSQLGSIAGYTPSQCGQVLSLRDVLPWWRFAKQKTKGSKP